MENTNNEIMELKFTEEDILKTLLALEGHTRNSLMSLNFRSIAGLANSPEYLDKVYETCDYYITNYQMFKNAVKTFVNALEEQKEKGLEHTIDEMVGIYKGFSREDKLEFNKKLFDANNLESSLDNFNYCWNRLMKTLCGVKA